MYVLNCTEHWTLCTVYCTLFNIYCTVYSVHIPNTLIEFGQGRPRTGCLMTPLVSIQNSGPETFHEVRERGLASFSALALVDMVWENRVQELFDSVFFQTIFPPCLGLSEH